MTLKKFFLLISLCVTIFAKINFCVASVTHVPTPLPNSEYKDVKQIINENLDSLFPYLTQITIGNIKQDKSGAIIVKNILIKATDSPNVVINKIVFKDLDFGKKISKNIIINIKGLSITNLAKSLADSNIVSTFIDPKAIESKGNLVSIVMNNMDQNIYDLDIEYNANHSTCVLKLNSDNNKKKIAQVEIKLSNADLSNIIVDSDFLVSLEDVIENSKLKELKFNVDFSNFIKQIARQYLDKKYEENSALIINGYLGEKIGQFNLDINGKLGANDYLNLNLIINDINLADTQIKDFAQKYTDILNNAYVKLFNGNVNVDLSFSKDLFAKKSPVQDLFKTLDSTNIPLSLSFKLNYDDNSKYSSNLNIENDLANININYQAFVDGRLNLLSYLGLTRSFANNIENLYNCKNRLCVASLDLSYINKGLLEKIARDINKDPNTVPSNVLRSYGALLLLLSTQQDNHFLKDALSSFAKFLRNPKNITMHIKASRPLNQNVLLSMLLEDIIISNKNNSMQMNLNKKNPKIIHNIQKLFNISFDVNN